MVETALRRTFLPRLLNRTDDIMVSGRLTEEDLRRIVELPVWDIRMPLAERRVAGVDG